MRGCSGALHLKSLLYHGNKFMQPRKGAIRDLLNSFKTSIAQHAATRKQTSNRKDSTKLAINGTDNCL